MSPVEIAQLATRIVLAAIFAVMGVLHFRKRSSSTMRAMIPPAMRRPGWPSPAALVAITGVCELAGAAGLLAPWPQVRLAAGICLALFLIAVFPANAYAARHPETFGRAAIPFWPRLVAQVGLILAVLFAVLPI